MAIAGFDPKEFAANLMEQAREVIPADLPSSEKNFIATTLHRYCSLAGEALAGDETITLDAQQASIITQFIGEWTFHKSIDLIRSGIPLEKRDPILQKIAFAVFEEARDVIINNVDQNEAIGRVENAVTYAYQEALDEMSKQNQLDNEMAEKAKSESNIDKMAKESAEQNPEQEQPQQQEGGSSKENDNSQKLLRLAAIAMLLRKMKNKNLGKILSKFDDVEGKAISSYIKIEGIEEAFDMDKINKFMHDFLMTIPEEAQAYNEKQTRKRYTELAKSVSEEELEAVLRPERSKVKKSLMNAKNVSEMPSRVSNIVFEYIKDKVGK